MKKITYTGLVLVLTLAITAPAFSQAPGTDGTAYGVIFNEKDPAKKADLSLKFMTDFKDTSASYSEPVAKLAVQNYIATKNWAKVFETADLFSTVMPKAKPATSIYVYSQAMTAAGQANDMNKLMTYGDKVLAVDPNDLNALFTLTTTIAENLPKDEAAKTAAEAKALAYGQKLAMATKPATVPDDAWQTQIQGPVHYAMGNVQFAKGDFDSAIAEYDKDLQLNPKDAVGQYQLGLAHRGVAMALRPKVIEAYNAFTAAQTAKTPDAADLGTKFDAVQADFNAKLDVAIESLQKAVSMGGEVAGPAQTQIDNLKKLK